MHLIAFRSNFVSSLEEGGLNFLIGNSLRKESIGLDLLKVAGKIKKHLPNGGLMVIYQGTTLVESKQSNLKQTKRIVMGT